MGDTLGSRGAKKAGRVFHTRPAPQKEALLLIDFAALTAQALAFGFTNAGPLRGETLEFLPQVRQMCAADRCGLYGRSWTCPPHCGSLEECARRAGGYRWGLLVQYSQPLADPFDYETMEAAGRRHRALFAQFIPLLRRQWPGLLPLGSGGCSLCQACTCPKAPCRHPDLASCSMEAYGLEVGRVCDANGLPYGAEGAITYTGCYLLE